MESGRLIVDSAASGSWNMALDQALLHQCERQAQATLRFYFWKPATITLGYFQNYSQRNEHLASVDCDLVRRVTGGGAIMHDHEITYSLIVPSTQRWSIENEALYRKMHQAIIEALEEQSVKTKICETSETDKAHHFLCFQRRTEGDLLLGNDKVGGSAQRRSRKSLLQHGSLLIRRSSFAPELPGIVDLSGQEIDQSSLIESWVRSLSKILQIRFNRSQYTKDELDSAEAIRNEKFESSAWNVKR